MMVSVRGKKVTLNIFYALLGCRSPNWEAMPAYFPVMRKRAKIPLFRHIR